ncbi:MAG: SDR family oxidoreductase [Spirochaetia bacterium]
MSETFFITGAAGNVGSHTAAALVEQGKTVIAGIRPGSLSGCTRKNTAGIEYRFFDFTRPETWESALAGTDKIFLMRPPQIANIKRDMYPFLVFLKQKPVSHVVFMSVQDAEKRSIIPHAKIEKYCRELELPYTFIRPSFFMQNLTTTHLPEIREENMLFIPAGDGRANFIDARDIGEAAARILSQEGHVGQAYHLTGMESFSYSEAAALLTAELEKKIVYRSPRPLPFIRYHLRRGRKLGMILVMLALYTSTRFKGLGKISPDLENILVRKPRNLKDFIRGHRSLFFQDQQQ